LQYNKIKTWPGYVLTIDDHPLFPPSETPKKLYISFSGIKRGEYWIEGDEQPQNRSCILEYVEGEEPYYSGIIYGDINSWRVRYMYSLTGCYCLMDRLDGRPMFYGSYEGDNIFSAENRLTIYHNWYGEGSFQVVARHPSTEPSFGKTLEQIGIEKAKKTYVEFAPISANLCWQKIFRKSDATCILVKKDTSRPYVCIGELTPDSTGIYDIVGFYDNKIYCTRKDPDYYLWWDSIAGWIISEVLGVRGTLFWRRPSTNIIGLYGPQGTATGIAEIALSV